MVFLTQNANFKVERRSGKGRGGGGKSNNNTELEAAPAQGKKPSEWLSNGPSFCLHIYRPIWRRCFFPFPSSPGRAECTQQIRPCKTKEAAFVTSLNFELRGISPFLKGRFVCLLFSQNDAYLKKTGVCIVNSIFGIVPPANNVRYEMDLLLVGQTHCPILV